ncbi:hypothetical protein GCM10018790_34830 [Kitasatospora xanthocidica]|nr:hypothetical protein GCM10018790_34830 [Kitasatospora xanthocidica]
MVFGKLLRRRHAVVTLVVPTMSGNRMPERVHRQDAQQQRGEEERAQHPRDGGPERSR